MTYVALLRGINVGGNRKVDMKQLTALFEDAGFESVKTYINSGNVIFQHTKHSTKELTHTIESIIKKKFGFEVPVVIRTQQEISQTVTAIKPHWKNDSDMRCDILFLWDEIDTKNTLKELNVNKEIDTIKYTPGAIIWHLDRKNVSKSAMHALISNPVYKKMTIRNCNTVRKLHQLMTDL